MSAVTMEHEAPSPGTVYLLHFDEPIGNMANSRAQAQHYIGWAADPEARLEAHRGGAGARITAWCAQAGIGFDIVRTWTGDRRLERRLKNRKCAPKLCPVCSAANHEEEQ